MGIVAVVEWLQDDVALQYVGQDMTGIERERTIDRRLGRCEIVPRLGALGVAQSMFDFCEQIPSFGVCIGTRGQLAKLLAGSLGLVTGPLLQRQLDQFGIPVRSGAVLMSLK